MGTSPPRSRAKPRPFSGSAVSVAATTHASSVGTPSTAFATVHASPAAAIIQKIERDRASYSVSRDAEVRLRQELEESKLALFRRSHMNEEASQRELESLRVHYEATIQEKELQWQKKCADVEADCKGKLVQLMDETLAQIEAVKRRAQEEKEALMQVSNERVEAEEAAKMDLDRKLRKAEKHFASMIKVSRCQQARYNKHRPLTSFVPRVIRCTRTARRSSAALWMPCARSSPPARCAYHPSPTGRTPIM